MTLQLIERLWEHAHGRPDGPAVRHWDALEGEHIITYGQLHAEVNALARRILRELLGDATILLCYPNQLEYVIAFYAAVSAGATVFPVYPQSSDTELIMAARRSGAVAVMGTDHAQQVLQAIGVASLSYAVGDGAPGGEPAGGDLDGLSDGARLLLQSSGTTGRPHIVERSGRSLDAVARNVVHGIGLVPSDRVLALIPLCHSYGVENGMLAPLYAGACIDLCPRLDAAEVLHRITEGGVTVLPGVPTLLELLAQAADGERHLNGLRSAYSAGSQLPASVVKAFQQRFRVRVGQLYGMTEIGSVTFNDPRGEHHDPASVGRPLDGVSLRIVDPATGRLDQSLPAHTEGEVAVAAPSMLTGYLGDDEARCEAPPNLRDGYFLTGDLGRLDEWGNLTITGRLKLLFDVGGLKVNLLEVEEAAREFDGVRDCVVVPVAVSETVSRLKAIVIPDDTHGELSLDGLRGHLRMRLSPHKVPRMFEVRNSVPRTATGKVLRHLL